MLVLAIETSTSSVKVALFDSATGQTWKERRKIDKTPGQGLLDADGVFELAVRAVKEAAAGQDVAAIALCGTWHSVMICERDMKPVSPVYTWEYSGAADLCGRLRDSGQQTDFYYRRTGCMPHSIYARHVLQVLRTEGLCLDDKICMTQGAYMFYRLTGELVETASMQSGAGLINIHSLVYDQDILDSIGIGTHQLGRLAGQDECGALSEQAAGLLGLRAGIPVTPAYPDGALNQVGDAASRPGVMTLSVGTSGAIRLVCEQPVLPPGRELWCYYGLTGWMSGAAVSGACNCIDWFCDTYCSPPVTPEEMETRTGGTDPPIFMPYLFGERCPGWNDGRRAAFHDVSPAHTTVDFYRAVQMGILFNLYQCYEKLCDNAGKPDEIIVSGGITKSEIWLGMLADLFGREMSISHDSDASSAGAIALGLRAAGGPDAMTEIFRRQPPRRHVGPNAGNQSAMKKKYARFLELYQYGL